MRANILDKETGEPALALIAGIAQAMGERDATFARYRGGKLTPEQTRAFLATMEKCGADCPGWCISERSDNGFLAIERCDECAVHNNAVNALYDDDVMQLHEARIELRRVRSRDRGARAASGGRSVQRFATKPEISKFRAHRSRQFARFMRGEI